MEGRLSQQVASAGALRRLTLHPSQSTTTYFPSTCLTCEEIQPSSSAHQPVAGYSKEKVSISSAGLWSGQKESWMYSPAAGCFVCLFLNLNWCKHSTFVPPSPALNFYFSLIAGSDVCVSFYFDLLPTCAWKHRGAMEMFKNILQAIKTHCFCTLHRLFPPLKRSWCSLNAAFPYSASPPLLPP